MVTYRFGSWVYHDLKVPVFRTLLKFIYLIINFIVRIVSKSEIPANCKIGSGLRIEHGGNGIILHKNVSIGKNAVIFQQVTIGIDPLKDKYHPPKIGDNGFIGAGAKLIGNIIVGDNVIIGANAVVIHDVPSNVTAVGVPARYIEH